MKKLTSICLIISVFTIGLENRMNQYQKLVDKEIAYQQQKSLKRRIKRARFPIIKLLSDFDYQFQPSIN
ncbi:ATP-binding protein, partial [Limosilactobacillus reuteri]|uniref:ATP-binding protein n=1 Tax=Limosilactobacillus reuteri TaxID=1598 RepID=UPI0039848A30